MSAITEPDPTELHATIKLGTDARAEWFYVARQLGGATPQPVRKMTPDGLLRFVATPQRIAREVLTCHEAGAFGYHPHRGLAAMGVTNHVVQPVDWDERGKGSNIPASPFPCPMVLRIVSAIEFAGSVSLRWRFQDR